eukprot:gene18155-811_t
MTSAPDQVAQISEGDKAKETATADEIEPSCWQRHQWLVWSFITFALFGLSFFFIGVVAEITVDKKKNAGKTGISASLVGGCSMALWSIPLAVINLKRGALNWDVGIKRWSNLVLMTLVGILTMGGVVAVSVAIALDPASKGPITSIVPINAVVCAILAWVHLKERLGWVHIMAMV